MNHPTRRADDNRPALPLRWGERFTLLLTGPNAGVVGAYGATWPGQPAEYERVNVCVEGAQKLDDIEQYRLQMAGISTAALGYWKLGDTIHPDYETPALRDVAALYAKYEELFKFREKVRDMVRMLRGHEWAEDLTATGDAAELQSAITKLLPNQTMHPDDAAVLRWADAMAEKMARSRAKGRSGWYDTNMCTAEQLNTMLVDHLGKGDPLDVAILAMMLWSRRERTTALAGIRQEEIIAFGASLLGHASTTDGMDEQEARTWVLARWLEARMQPPSDAVDAALVDAVVHGTGAFRVHGDGTTERVELTKEQHRHYAELAAFPPKLQRDALYQDYAVPEADQPKQDGDK